MPTNPLTDADLAAIEARHTTTLDNGERVIDEDTAHLLAAVREARAERDEALAQAAEYRRLADVAEAHAETALGKLSGAEAERNWARVERDEARALVGRLTVDDPIYYGGRDGNDTECWYCGAPVMKNFAGDIKIAHEADCDWFAAREALAAWKGDRDA